MLLLQERRNSHPLKRLQGNHNRRARNRNRQKERTHNEFGVFTLVRLAAVQNIGKAHHNHSGGCRGQERPDQVHAELFDLNIGACRPGFTPAGKKEGKEYPQRHGGYGGDFQTRERGNRECCGDHQHETTRRF